MYDRTMNLFKLILENKIYIWKEKQKKTKVDPDIKKIYFRNTVL